MAAKTTDEKLAIVQNIIKNPNNPIGKVTINFQKWEKHYRISQITLRKWVKDYKEFGIDGLVNKSGLHKNHHNAGRKPKQEQSELEKLRKENTLLKAQLDFLKKFWPLAESLRKKDEK